MQVRIHRGATEIGGSCVEIRHGRSTILLDIGRPLWAGRNEHVPLPNAVGLGEPGPPPLAVVLSHGHQDHWGLVPQLPENIPVYIGRGAADVLRAAEFWGSGINLKEAGHLQHQTPIQIGPFTVTPLLADHSAFDAYSLLVEAGGRRLLYSGDFRGHGRKHRAFDALLATPPQNVDVLLLEGTNLRHAPDQHGDPVAAVKTQREPIATETEVEAEMVATMRATKGLTVVLASAQNIDRLVTVYRAALKANRNLAIDLYTADIAAATGRDTIPQLGDDWPRVSAYLPLRQRVKVKQAEEFERTKRIRGRRIFDEHLTVAPENWVLLGSLQSHIPHLLKSGLLEHGAVIWSLWDGYLAEQSGRRLTSALANADVPLVHHHTSGHASPRDLQRLVAAVNPTTIVPIHTEAPERYGMLFPRVDRRNDGKWWDA